MSILDSRQHHLARQTRRWGFVGTPPCNVMVKSRDDLTLHYFIWKNSHVIELALFAWFAMDAYKAKQNGILVVVADATGTPECHFRFDSIPKWPPIEITTRRPHPLQASGFIRLHFFPRADSCKTLSSYSSSFSRRPLHLATTPLRPDARQRQTHPTCAIHASSTECRAKNEQSFHFIHVFSLSPTCALRLASHLISSHLVCVS